MAQVFHPSTNPWSKVSLLTLAGLALGLLILAFLLARSPYATAAEVVREQPVPFSHKHHVAELGIQCLYCHTSAEDAAFAGIPPTHTCMSCHSQVWLDSPVLEPVRESFRSGDPVPWIRVHDLPDFVYFDHSIHLKKGVGCASCHGRVDQMNLTYKGASMQMVWCLECHREPERFVRPLDRIYDMEWDLGARSQLELGRQLVEDYDIQTRTNCSTCHR